METTIELKTYRAFVSGISATALLILIAFPAPAQAFSLWDTLTSILQPVASANAAPTVTPLHLVSETPTLRAALNIDPTPAKGANDMSVVENVALMAEVGPEGTLADIDASLNEKGHIALYVVRKGDTLAAIAKAFGVSVNTISWANDIKNGNIKVGDQLVILPVTGVKHTVKKGESLTGIVKQYKADLDETIAFNNLSTSTDIAVGAEIIIPYGVETVVAAPTTTSGTKPTSKPRGTGGPDLAGYFIRPVDGGRKSQGIHGFNGVDISIPVGSRIKAAASGTVVVARGSGWNGGYGLYVVISHGNGTQTLYAHLSQVNVSTGDQVTQGDTIGLSGNTGKSTGAHLHFEVRGAKNPF